MLKNIKKCLIYTINSEKSLFFGKFYPLPSPVTTPQIFFGPLEGGENPPTSHAHVCSPQSLKLIKVPETDSKPTRKIIRTFQNIEKSS